MTDTEMILQAIEVLRNDMNSEISGLRTDMSSEINSLRTDMSSEINSLRTDMHSRFENIDKKFEEVNEQLREIDTSIGMLADWADSVATVTKVPFASGQTSIK